MRTRKKLAFVDDEDGGLHIEQDHDLVIKQNLKKELKNQEEDELKDNDSNNSN